MFRSFREALEHALSVSDALAQNRAVVRCGRRYAVVPECGLRNREPIATISPLYEWTMGAWA